MAGRLVYVVGPSGAGKDSLLQALAQRLEGRAVLAQRVITRVATDAEPGCLSVSESEFLGLQSRGRFAMTWQANGLRYGIPDAINQRLEQGISVLVNGSRAHLQQAWERYPTMLGVVVTVPQTLLRLRLEQRAREDAAQISQRLKRAEALRCVWPGDQGSCISIDNSGSLDASVRILSAWLDERLPKAIYRGSLCV